MPFKSVLRKGTSETGKLGEGLERGGREPGAGDERSWRQRKEQVQRPHRERERRRDREMQRGRDAEMRGGAMWPGGFKDERGSGTVGWRGGAGRAPGGAQGAVWGQRLDL